MGLEAKNGSRLYSLTSGPPAVAIRLVLTRPNKIFLLLGHLKPAPDTALAANESQLIPYSPPDLLSDFAYCHNVQYCIIVTGKALYLAATHGDPSG